MVELSARDSKLVQYLNEAYGKEKGSKPHSKHTSA